MPEIKLEMNEINSSNFNLYADGNKAGEMAIKINDRDITVYHTEVAPEYEGKGYAKLLLDALIAEASKRHIKVIPLCPYVYAQFKRHPEAYTDVWKKESPHPDN